MFLSLLCLTKLHLFDKKFSKNSNIVKYYYNLRTVFYLNICNIFLIIVNTCAAFVIFLMNRKFKQHLFKYYFYS